jgi:hypothetical protein
MLAATHGLLASVAVGVVVWLASRAFAAGSCPIHDSLRAASSCRALIGSLAIRVGITAGVAVLLMELLSAGLRRTTEAIDEERQTAAREGSAGLDNSG